MTYLQPMMARLTALASAHGSVPVAHPLIAAAAHAARTNTAIRSTGFFPRMPVIVVPIGGAGKPEHSFSGVSHG